jgi:hypothetical protein
MTDALTEAEAVFRDAIATGHTEVVRSAQRRDERLTRERSE